MSPPPSGNAGKQVAVVFTDLADSVALKVRLGVLPYRDRVLGPHDALFRAILADCPGAFLYQDTGDGFLAHFPSCSDAVLACLRFQYAIHSQNWELEKPRVRIGIHTGDVTVLPGTAGYGDKFVGVAVDMAARIMGLAQPGQILMTRSVYDSARHIIQQHPPVNGLQPVLRWEEHGLYLFKGNNSPVEVFEVGVPEVAPLSPPPDSEKGHPFVPTDQGSNWCPGPGLSIPGCEHWLLQRKLGEGGSGEVWLVQHAKLKQLRVFKFCVKLERLPLLKLEVTVCRLLQDTVGRRPDIASISDFRFTRPPYFLEIEFASEGSLLDWARASGGVDQLPLPARLELVAQVATALEAAHQVGVIHADVKPANILLRKEGERLQAVLTDFGIGRITNVEQLRQRNITVADLTRALEGSSGWGTPGYQAPELLTGRTPTTRSDIYALGVVLYQMARGDLQASFGPGWERDISDPLLQEDIACCVDHDPNHRLGSAAQLAERLRKLEDRRAEQLRHQKREGERRRRRRLVRVLGGATLLLLTLLGVAGWGYLTTARALAREQKLVYFQKVLQAHRAWNDRLPGLMEKLLAGAPPELCDWEWHYLKGLVQGDHTRLDCGQGEILSVAFSPDDRYLTSAGQDGTVKIWEVTNRNSVKLFKTWTMARPEPVLGVIFLRHNGRLEVAAAAGTSVLTWDVANEKVRLHLHGHTGKVRCLAVSPDGRQLASGGEDRVVRIWDTASGAPIPPPAGGAPLHHREPVLSVAFSEDGQRLASASGDLDMGLFPVRGIDQGEIRVWDTSTWQQTCTIRADTGPVHGVAFQPHNPLWTLGPLLHFNQPLGGAAVLRGLQESRYLASSNYDALVRLWTLWKVEAAQPDFTTIAEAELRKYMTTVTIHNVTTAYGVAFAPDGQRLASCSGDQTVQLGDPQQGKDALQAGREDLPVLAGHTGYVYAVAFSRQRDLLASASADGTVRLWETRRNPRTIPLEGHDLAVLGVAFQKNGGRIASASLDGTVRLWSATGEAGPVLQEHRNLVPMLGHCLAPQSPLALGAREHLLRSTHFRAVYAVSFHPQQQWLAAAGADGTVRIWDVRSGEELQHRRCLHSGIVYAAAYDPRGRYLASAADDGSIRLWDAATSKGLRRWDGHAGAVHALAFSPDGHLLASASADGTVKVWDVNSGAEVRTLRGHTGPVYCLAFQGDGRRFASGGADKTIRLWDTATGAEVLSIADQHTEAVLGLAFNPGAKSERLASASQDSSVRLWDTTTGEQVFVSYHNFHVYCVAFDHVGRRLASGSCYPGKTEEGELKGTGIVRILEAATGPR